MTMEAKKDSLRQTQDGTWKLTLTVHPNDMPLELLQDPMGTAYGVAMVKIDYDNQDCNNLPQKEKFQDDKMRIRAVMLCKEKEFQDFAILPLKPDQYHGYHKEQRNPEEVAKEYLCRYCGIKSRSELTTNKQAQELFKNLIEQFYRWKDNK